MALVAVAFGLLVALDFALVPVVFALAWVLAAGWAGAGGGVALSEQAAIRRPMAATAGSSSVFIGYGGRLFAQKCLTSQAISDNPPLIILFPADFRLLLCHFHSTSVEAAACPTPHLLLVSSSFAFDRRASALDRGGGFWQTDGMTIFESERPLVWGELDVPLLGLARDWQGVRVEPAADFSTTTGGRRCCIRKGGRGGFRRNCGATMWRNCFWPTRTAVAISK